MMLHDLVRKCRSYRRYFQHTTVFKDELMDMVDNARFAANGGNAQALRYRIVNTAAECAKVFPALTWAKALPDWDGPAEGERPSAYIIICCDLSVGQNRQWDEGIAAQTILLSATEKGYGGCILASIDRPRLAQALNIDPAAYSIGLVLAIGKPKESVIAVPMEPGDTSTDYYRDRSQTHFVPKRQLRDILL